LRAGIEILPSGQVLFLARHWAYAPAVLWPSLATFRISPCDLYTLFRQFFGVRPDETSPVQSPTVTIYCARYTGEFFTVDFLVLHRFIAFAMRDRLGSLMLPPYEANISALHVPLYVTGCCFAPLSREVTMSRHSHSSTSIGCVQPGGPTFTRTRLSPASSR
jgi:hypothetical protein